ncbi:MAG: HAAS signaling domain-containing protein [Georgenia sp.]
MTDTDRSIAAYLDDLARMLTGADPVLRAEVLGGVREHIDAALAGRTGGGTSEDVDAVLLELGPPERIAAAALGDGATWPGAAPGWAEPGAGPGWAGPGTTPGASPAWPGPGAAPAWPGPGAAPAWPGPGAAPGQVPPRPAALDRSWVPPLVGLLLLFSAGVYLLVLGALATFAVTDTVVTSEVGVVTESGAFHAPATEEFAAAAQNPLLTASYDMVWVVLAPLPVVVLPWLLSTVLLAASSLWCSRQKWSGVLLLPGLVVLSALTLAIALAVPAGVGRSVLLAGVMILAAVTVVRVVARVWGDGARRARELATAPPLR